MGLMGERVMLRGIEEGDVDLLKTLINDPEVGRYLSDRSFPVSELQQREWIRAQVSQTNVKRLVITLKENQESIGVIMLRDIDWKNRKAYTGIKMLNVEKFRKKGYACEARKILNKHVFLELGLNRLEATALSDNKASIRNLEMSGYKFEGVKRKDVYTNGEFHDVNLYGLLKEEFLEMLNQENTK